MSLLAQIIYSVILKSKVPCGEISSDYSARRLANSKIKSTQKLTRGVKCEEISFNGIPAEKYTVKKSRYTLFYVHGGGFTMGSVATGRKFISTVCKRNSCNAVSIDYRLAPEHQFPVGLTDCFVAYKEYVKTNNPKETIFIGESAGANLVICLALKILDEKLPMPSAIVAMAPPTSFDRQFSSYINNVNIDCMLNDKFIEEVEQSYVNDGNLHHRYISPMFTDLTGLPPIFLPVGEREVLLDDSVVFAKKLQEYGVNATAKVYKNMFHSFQNITVLPESKKCIKDIDNFISRVLSV